MLNMVKWSFLSRMMSLCKDDGLQTSQWRTRWVDYELQSLRHSVCLKIRTPRLAVSFPHFFSDCNPFSFGAQAQVHLKRLFFFSFLVHNPKKPCPLSFHFRRTKIFRSGVWLTRPGGDLSRYQGACGTSIRPGVGSGCIPASNRGRAAGVDWLVRIGIILGGLKFEDTWLQKMLFCLNCVELSEYVPEKLEP